MKEPSTTTTLAILDDGWPESVEEQSLLLLVWRHAFYTQALLHTDAFTHRRFYTQKLLHTSKIAIFPQFLTIDPHFVRKGCVSCRLVGTAPAPAFKREIEKKERARGQEEKM